MKTAQGFGRTGGLKAGMPLGRDGLGSAPAQFQVMPPLPSPGGELAAPQPQVSDSLGLKWNLETYLSNRFPPVAAVGPGNLP